MKSNLTPNDSGFSEQQNSLTESNKKQYMKTILFPTDFSETSEKALNVVRYIAQKSNACIHVFHVYNIPVTLYNNMDAIIPPQIIDDVRISAEKEAAALKKNLEADGFIVEVTVEMGSVTDEIISITHKNSFDLLIMGTTGDGNLVNKIIGSNASAVLMRVNIPVLLVPKDCVFDGFKSIVYLDELKDDDIEVLDALFSLSKEIGVRNLSLLNINTGFFFEPVDEKLMTRLTTAFGADQLVIDSVTAADVKQGIDLYLEQTQIDLVVMSTKKKTILERLFVKSNTKIMAMQSKIPLLVYHRNV
ncbi:MAG: universal stress protein [Chitinophagales bacterium]